MTADMHVGEVPRGNGFQSAPNGRRNRARLQVLHEGFTCGRTLKSLTSVVSSCRKVPDAALEHGFVWTLHLTRIVHSGLHRGCFVALIVCARAYVCVRARVRAGGRAVWVDGGVSARGLRVLLRGEL